MNRTRAPANLDALCRRFGVDATARTRHGALLDAQLLSEVYLQLKGGRQPGLVLAATAAETAADTGTAAATRWPRSGSISRPCRPPPILAR